MGIAQLATAATFLLVLVLIVGPYYWLVVRSEAEVHQNIQQRIRGPRVPSVAAAARVGVLREVNRLSSIGPLNALLARGGVLSGTLDRLIQRASVNVSVGAFVLMCGCLALGAFVLVRQYAGLTLLALPVAAVASLLPIFVLKVLAGRRLRKFEEQFPEAVDLIARALRAGHAFPTGLRMAAEELPEPVAAEFRLLHDQQNYGLPLTDALKDFAQRLPLIDARFFVTAVLTQREAGGNLAEVLDNLSSVIRERFRIKRQLRVLTAHGRLTGWILGALPPAIAVVLALRVPDHFKLLLEDPLGVRMIVVAVIMQIGGGLLIRKITNIEY